MTVRVKICGVRRADDALLAAELGASAIGFVFWPGSPRFVDPYVARDVVRRLPPFVTPVGVFVNQPIAYAFEVAGLVKLGAIQLHGDEAAESYLRSPYRVIKAIAVRDGFDANAVAAVPERAIVLLDAHDDARRGGTGRSINWTVAAEIARCRPTILSGGLRADNIADAIAAVRPYAVDVSSGVESAPGTKDPGALRALFAAVRETESIRT